MKRILLSTFVILLSLPFFNQTQAQDIKLGVRAGGNLSSWRGDAINNVQTALNLASVYLNEEVISPEPRPGFHAGIYATIPLTTWLSFEPGVSYSQKGNRLITQLSSEKYDFLNLQGTLTNKLNYIEVPLYAKVYIAEGFHIFAGPQVSFLVSNSLNTRVQVAGFSILNRDWNVDPGYQKMDIGASAGVGYQFANGLNLRAGYDRGFQRLTTMDNLRAYNQAFKVSAGFEF